MAGNILIIGILIIIVLLALRGSIKHWKGEGGCCGGGPEPKVKRKKLEDIIAVKKIKIEGMSCDSCRKHVENALNSLDQVNARVNLEKKEAIVKLGEEVSDEAFRAAVEAIGYQVVSIERVR